MFQTLLYKVEDGVAVITLNRPEKLNAYNSEMMIELVAAFDRTDADDAVRAVIVTGSGRGFCSGVDLSAGRSPFDHASRGDQPEANGVFRDRGGRLTLRIFESLKPVIAAVNGPAVGIGATMLAAMDFRLASTAAKFSFLFARRGLVAEAASTWFLPRIMPIQAALEWCFTGRYVMPDEARDAGFLRSVHEPADLMPAALALGHEIASNSAPVSVALMRQMMWRMSGADHPMMAHEQESRAIQARSVSEDAKEGVAAFREKRAASFPERVSIDMPAFFPWWTDRPFT